jgi:hypothetical protein
MMQYSVTEVEGRLHFDYPWITAERDYIQKYPGLNLLFTNWHDWSTERIVSTYRVRAESRRPSRP